ncbi:MAG TPA: glycoside hydrolase family 15 protein [Thermoanaerobaculia bacterium]|nr:glycoside hydrolase family 15 protein [Thermoanaerobaculia bacterium]
MAYQPIEDYGIIGNMRTVALVGRNGSIDWYCFPYFDSPSVFGAILDDAKGGRFEISPLSQDVATKQLYWPETNVLVSRFLSADGVGEIEDFMPVGAPAEDPWRDQLIRRVRLVRGALKFRLRCVPAFDYARAAHETVVEREGACFNSSGLSLELATDVSLSRDGDGVAAEFTLKEGESATFVLRPADPQGGCGPAPSAQEMEALFQQTIAYWRRWISACTYHGRWREMVHRSALALKLLTFEPTGAIVAAPTCSLPEHPGGVRNWDYRYTWMRDAAFTVYALLRIGLTEEASRFMSWIDSRCAEADRDAGLQIVYGIDGRRDLTEVALDHLDGYRGSKPVRVGNAAFQQLQLDIYGELLDSVYLYNKYAAPISYDTWLHLRELLHYVGENWQREDEGIWEVRGGRRHFVFSKLMCWVAMDRGLRLADKRSFPADRERWQAVRDEIYDGIMQQGWNAEHETFVQSYGSDWLDASNLIMPLVFFVAPNDPRMLKTLEAIRRPPDRGGLLSDGLVYRYNTAKNVDGIPGSEGTFNMCTFWLVEALTRAGRIDPGLLDEARLLFERMLGYANHLGLYAEQTGLRGEALGNFPQAFTHIAVISAAFNLDRTLGRERGEQRILIVD